MTEAALDIKLTVLKKFFEAHKKVALAFSGGVDSAYLFYAAKENGCDIRPYFVKTMFQPQFELDDAQRLASEAGVDLNIIEHDLTGSENIVCNEKDRCYHCKLSIFNAIRGAALKDGINLIIDGTNASDDFDDRPGMKAILELNVRSPLREAGLTKDEIRSLCRKAGLFVWDKPAYACLATRIPAGTAITMDILQNVEKAEDFMMKLGFSDFRVRHFHCAAKIQVKAEQFEKACSMKEEILRELSEYFDGVLLDFNTRK